MSVAMCLDTTSTIGSLTGIGEWNEPPPPNHMNHYIRNFNQNLRYLNLSGNKRLEIKPDTSPKLSRDQNQRRVLADFSSLLQLRVLGLMDVTTTFAPTIPDENEDRRVRTSSSEVNQMAYGIADTLGKTDHVTMFDLVQPQFRQSGNEAVFALFGRAHPVSSNNRFSKYIRDNFLQIFSKQLEDLNKDDTVPDALRRTFLRLNKMGYDTCIRAHITSEKPHTLAFPPPITQRSQAAAVALQGIVVYISDKTLYVANSGNALAVISRHGQAVMLSRKHDPFEEIGRIRSAEGWVSPKGLVNDEIDVSRSFGFFHLLPVVNACPDTYTWPISEVDEFVIVGNRGLWDFVSPQTAVDIARQERADPMIAAQKLRDFAISYGADGSTMIMVIKVSDIFNPGPREATRRKKKDDISSRAIRRLDDEVDAPRGHIALVFTDIRNSTRLWETNAGMPAAMSLHGDILRRQLRICGGYEVKTEGDAFMCSFHTVLSALLWCLSVQVDLLNADWPADILESDEGREIRDQSGRPVARGLSVRMGIHCGHPVCEPDPVTHRMDYFGPMVNRSSRISGSAAGGQIMCSADVVREINAKILEEGPETEFSFLQPPAVVEAIRAIGVVMELVGEVKLKGLEVPELLSLVFPRELEGRRNMEQHEAMSVLALNPKVQFTAEQVRALGLLCLRFESLSASRVFNPLPDRKGSASGPSDDAGRGGLVRFAGNPNHLLPSFEKLADDELLSALGSFTVRIENAVKMLLLQHHTGQGIFRRSGQLGSVDSSERTLEQLMSVLCL
jgi:adenylate cyclase